MQCKHFYFDLGTNVGVQIEKLYNPSCITPFQKIFENAFPERSKVCTIGFEPNPNHVSKLQSLSRRYLNLGYYVYVHYGFAGIENSVSKLFLNPEFANGKFNNMWSAGHKRQHTYNNTPINVPSLNILPLLQSVPKYGNIVLKMDIEHDEHIILPALNRSGLLCKINYVVFEWHGSRKNLDNIQKTMTCTNTKIIELDDNILCEKSQDEKNATFQKVVKDENNFPIFT